MAATKLPVLTVNGNIVTITKEEYVYNKNAYAYSKYIGIGFYREKGSFRKTELFNIFNTNGESFITIDKANDTITSSRRCSKFYPLSINSGRKTATANLGPAFMTPEMIVTLTPFGSFLYINSKGDKEKVVLIYEMKTLLGETFYVTESDYNNLASTLG